MGEAILYVSPPDRKRTVTHNRSPSRSSATSRSYWLCSPIQNTAEFPKIRESSNTVSAEIPRLQIDGRSHQYGTHANKFCESLPTLDSPSPNPRPAL